MAHARITKKANAMLDLNLCDKDVEYYDDFFQRCDPDSSEVIQSIRLVKLLKSADMPSAIINTIMDLCCTVEPRTNNQLISRHQFYAALKLTAAYQIGVPLRREVLAKKHDLPLPKFIWATISSKSSHAQTLHINYKPHIDVFSTDSDENVMRPVESNCSTTDLLVASPVENDSCWPTTSAYDEQIQLLATEESDDRHSSDDNVATNDIDDSNGNQIDEDLLKISIEQRNHYVEEFRQVAAESSGYLSFSQASKYFAESYRSVTDINKVWKLTTGSKNHMDVEEFIISMHLLWLKRNKIIFSFPNRLNFTQLPIKTNKEWTKFNESPVTVEKSLTGVSLANCDFEDNFSVRESNDFTPDDNSSKIMLRLQSKRYQSNESGPSSLPPPPMFPPTMKKDFPLPPPPPPRPIRQHGRSSSLDLSRKPLVHNQLPTVPPRTISSPKKQTAYETESFADFENQKDSMDLSLKMINSLNALSIPKSAQLQRDSAFEIYKKKPSTSSGNTSSYDQLLAVNKSNWHSVYRELKQEKALLMQSCVDLKHELESVKEEKLKLKLQLRRKQLNRKKVLNK